MTETIQEPSTKSVESDMAYLTDFKPRIMDWSAARVFATKNLKIAIRYPANFLVWGVLPILWFAPFILMATAIAGPSTSTHFTNISGFDDFVQFSVIGWFVFMYLDNSIWGIGNNFRWEQFSGTLEPLFTAPVPRISILLGAAFSDSIQGTLQAIIMLIFAMFLFGVEYAITAIFPTVLILLIMVFALYGFGFMVAGLILVFKDPSVLTQLIAESTYMLSPIQYPVQALPKSVQAIAYVIPTTIGIITVREIAINGTMSLPAFVQSIGALGFLALIFWGLGMLSFKWAEKWTKERGHMGGF
ncbi:MAG: conserved membrane protein of unknown function [Candidatus Thorarchaeota archaeon]|nr:MAG: conserved membrane protein of unknown function [Candidatus Thorarchaeota archaeon]